MILSSFLTLYVTILHMKQKSTIHNFGDRLREIRRQRGLTQEQLGKLVNVSGRIIAYYEGQSKYPPTHLIKPLTEALKVSADELLGFKTIKHEISRDELAFWKRFKKIKDLPLRDRRTILALINAVNAKHKNKSAGTHTT
jgi:transcriptional regulator with XRE-family HTH domain